MGRFHFDGGFVGFDFGQNFAFFHLPANGHSPADEGAFGRQTLLIDLDLPSSILNSHIRLFDGAGNQLAANDDGVGPSPESSALESFLAFTVPAAGTYYVGVSSSLNVAYNAVTVVETAIRAEHGRAEADQLSKYYMALEIASSTDGMLVVLEDSDFDVYRAMPVAEFCTALRQVARHIDPSQYRKSTRGPKKPVKKKRHNKRRVHVSVAKVLSQNR